MATVTPAKSQARFDRWLDATTKLLQRNGLDFSATEIAAIGDYKKQNQAVNGADVLSYVRQNPTIFQSYAQRFPGIADLVNKGYLNPGNAEGQFTAQQNQYKINLMSGGITEEQAKALSAPDKTRDLMLAEVSPDEVKSRIDIANELINSSGGQFAQDLQTHYGLGRGDALAFLLDSKTALPIITAKANDNIRGVSLAVKANQYGLNLTPDQVDQLSAMTATDWASSSSFYGRNRALGEVNDKMQTAALTASTDATLSGFEGTDYSSFEAAQAAFGNQEAQLKSRARAQREQAKFAGSSGVDQNSLSVYRNL
jgi:hypothetical protein